MIVIYLPSVHKLLIINYINKATSGSNKIFLQYKLPSLKLSSAEINMAYEVSCCYNRRTSTLPAMR